MHLFILNSSQFDVPQLILNQKVLDIIELGQSIPGIHIYVVGSPLQSAKELTIQYKTALEAKKLIGELSQPIIFHFGATLNVDASIAQYFIPLSPATSSSPISFFKKWALQNAYKKFIQKSKAIYAINDWASDFLVKYYKKYNTKIKTAYLPTSTVAHIDWVELAAAKNKLTEGAHYFLAFQPLENFVDMLKEFSVFKKWQQTNMALVFIFENELAVWQANKLISGYTFKDSVIIKSIEELEMSWIAATYAITFNGTYFDKAILMEMAIQYNIPLLINTPMGQQQPIVSAWTGAGEWFSFAQKGALSNHFKLYYKDEQYRQTRAQQAKEWLHHLYAQTKQLASVLVPLSHKSA